MHRAVSTMLAFVPVLGIGCAHLVGVSSWDFRPPGDLFSGEAWSDGELPGRSEVVAGQLVIHADFPIAGQHRLVRELEEMRADVSQQLGLPISDEPVHLYLFENPDRYAEFVSARFPAFPSRRAFFVETDTTLSVFAAWQDRVAEDLRHETTHGYVHAVVPAVPLWLDEGIAEYFELPRAQRGRHQHHLAHLAGRIIEGTWRPDMERLESLEAAAAMSQDHYAEAWCWVHWLLNTTPERRALLQDYLADVRRDPATAPLSTRLRRVGPGDLAGELRGHVERLTAD
ncbi:MAG: DUF1570 domain-containing protein [Planctomycetes bacterium]|nr:DUF1570 domain-containing protein [Planctomycetota bacterium]